MSEEKTKGKSNNADPILEFVGKADCGVTVALYRQLNFVMVAPEGPVVKV